MQMVSNICNQVSFKLLWTAGLWSEDDKLRFCNDTLLSFKYLESARE